MKILFFAEAASLAHIGRPLLLAKWAHEIGIEVHFASSLNGLKITNANSYGFATHSLYTIDSQLFYDRVNQGKFFYQTNELKKYVEEEKALILKIKPNLIVSDFRLTTAISAELTGTTLLNLSNSYWSPNSTCKFPAPDAGVFKFMPQKTTNFIFNLIRPMAFKFFGNKLNLVRKHFGLKSKSDFRELYTDGSITAYMDLPNFVKLNDLPKNHFFLGPLIWSPVLTQKPLPLKDSNNVYISMGSTGDNNTLPFIISSALKYNKNLIISGVSNANKTNLLKEFPQLENRSIIEPFISADEILPFCKLTICHGGSGTVYQSIAKGVPVLCFPKNPDQGLVALAVAQNNIGRYLTSKAINLKSVEKIFLECLDNELIKENTLNMKLAIEEWNTKSRWVHFLNKFKTIRKTRKVIA